MSCRRNVLSTMCSVDEVFCRRKFVDKMSCRRNVLSTKCFSTKFCRQNASTKILSTKCFSTKVSLDEKHRIPHILTSASHFGLRLFFLFSTFLFFDILVFRHFYLSTFLFFDILVFRHFSLSTLYFRHFSYFISTFLPFDIFIFRPNSGLP
jgi:hypothetical protein